MADDFERWRGEVSSQLINMARERRELMDQIDRDIRTVSDRAKHDDAELVATTAEIWKAVTDLRIQVSVLSTRIGVYAALGGLVGAIIVGVVVFAITGQIGGTK